MVVLVFSCSFRGLWGHSGQERAVATAISSFNFIALEAVAMSFYCNFWLGVRAQIKASLKDYVHYLKLNTHELVRLEPSAVPISLGLGLDLWTVHTNLVSVHSLESCLYWIVSIGAEAKGWEDEKTLQNLHSVDELDHEQALWTWLRTQAQLLKATRASSYLEISFWRWSKSKSALQRKHHKAVRLWGSHTDDCAGTL